MAQLSAWALSAKQACKDLWNGYTDLAHFRAETNYSDPIDFAFRSTRMERVLNSPRPVFFIRVTAGGMLKDLGISQSWQLCGRELVPWYQVFTFHSDPRDDTVECLASWVCPVSAVPLSDDAIMATAISMVDSNLDFLFGLAAYLLQRHCPSPETLPLFISVENWLCRRRLFDFAKYHHSLICVQRLAREKLPIWRERREAVRSLIASTTFLTDDLKPIVFGYVG